MATNLAEKVVRQEDPKKHPAGLWLSCYTIMWERFSYYGMRALLILYLTGSLVSGGLGMDKGKAALLYGYFTGFVYFTPLIGGWLADKYIGQKKAINIGCALIAAGQIALFIAPTKMYLYTGLILLILGNGFFKPNMSTLVGKLYDNDDPRKDAAYSIFYMAINVGAFIAPLITGFLAEQYFVQRQGMEIISYGYKYAFLAAGIGMILGQIPFMMFYDKMMGDIGQNPVGKSSGNKKAVNAEDMNRPLTKEEKDRTTVIFILSAFVIFFWAGFEQAGSSLTIYTHEFINRSVGGFTVPVGWFQSLNPILCVILGPIMAALWVRLSQREQGDLNVPTKMGLGIVLLGIGFLLMVGASMERGGSMDPSIKAHMFWLVGAYFLHTVGEMCLSPIGMSMVSKMAPVKLASLLMGVWLLSSFVSNIVGGYIASYVETMGHMQIFGGIALVSIVLGILLISLNKKLAKMMHLGH